MQVLRTSPATLTAGPTKGRATSTARRTALTPASPSTTLEDTVGASISSNAFVLRNATMAAEAEAKKSQQ